MLPSDETLLHRIAQSQSDALSALYDRYARLVYSLALQIVGEDGVAEEITQEVFLLVWRSAGSYRAEVGRVVTWLASVTRNRAIDMLRRRGARPEGHVVMLAEDAFNAIRGDGAVEPVVEDRLRSGRVQQALTQLPVEQREALLLAYFQGLTQQEIAEHLGQPLGTVKTRVRLGLQKLRALLSEEQVLND